MKKAIKRFHKTLTVLLAIVMAMCFTHAVNQPVFASVHTPNSITVTVHGTAVNFANAQPVIIDGRTLVPIRCVFEMLGFEVSWDRNTGQATLTRENDIVIITVGSARFSTNGTYHALDVPAQIIRGSTMLPLRAVLESVGYTLDWDRATQTVRISYGGYHYINDALPLMGRVIILDAGHGVGADNVFMGYSEQARMLRLALMIKPMLEDLGATVHLTRSTPANVPLHTRPALINRWTLLALRDASSCEAEIAEIGRLIRIMEKIINNPQHYAPIYMNAPFDRTRTRVIHPDMRQIFYLQNNPIIYRNFLAISLHSNSTPSPVNTSVHGADVYIISNTTYYNINYFSGYTNFERSWLFADLLLDGISQVGIARRQISHNSAFVMIREHNIPSVLVENGFHTNPGDRARLMCDVFLQNLAAVYVNAIVNYFCISNS